MNVAEIITAKIIEKLEQGIIPWRKPWKSLGAPRSFDGHNYRGSNLLLTTMAPYRDPRWITIKRLNELGGHVKKGEHATPVIYWDWLEVEKEGETGDETEAKRIPFMRYYRVFNVEQTEGWEIPPLEANSKPNDWTPIEDCEAIVAGMPSKPEIKTGNAAFYRPMEDSVTVPALADFDSPEEYYSALFHELGHATGHAYRLNREGITTGAHFGTGTYSKEELVAELTSAFLCGEAGISPAVVDNQAAYIQNWLKVLKADSRAVIIAAQQSQRAMDFILNRKIKVGA